MPHSTDSETVTAVWRSRAPAAAPSRRHARTWLAGAAVGALVTCGCVGTSPSGQELAGEAPRRTPDPALIGGAVTAETGFATALYKTVAGAPGNFVYSPWAVADTLAMARAGALGPTRAQFDTVLGASASPDLDGAFNALGQALAARSGERRSDTRKGTVNLITATSLWAQRGLHIDDPFLDVLSANYGTGIRVTDFHGDAEGAREAINNWASDATGGLSRELVPRGGVTPYTRFTATTAAYLQAPWLLRFDSTRTDQFSRTAEPPVDARFMELTAATGLRYGAGPGWQVVELPYLGDELELDVILPDLGLFESFEQSLGPEVIGAITASLQPRSLDVSLPQFQFTTSADLEDALSRMGLPLAFSRDADFSAVTTDDVLSLSGAAYQGYFDVDQDGTNPPANTATVQPSTAASHAGVTTVQINRPFVFVVRDRPTGALLWIGRVVNPV
jgi:serpin B